MSISAVATKVFSSPTLSVNSGSYGIVSQNDGSFIFGYSETDDTFPFDTHSKWFRSTDEGTSWATKGSDAGILGQAGAFPTNIRQNIICAPYALPASETRGLMRSLNGGQTWNSVFSAAPASSPNGRTVEIFGVQSMQRTHAVAWGELDGNNTNPPQIIAISTDAGATWTPQDSWDVGDKNDFCNAIGLAANGALYAQYTKFGGVNREAWLARSADAGATWSVVNSMGSIASPPWPTAYAIACFDANAIAMCGVRGAIPPDDVPGVWWSSDAGATLTLVPAADIVNWPGGLGRVDCYEVKRLTKDAVALAFEVQNGQTPQECWCISLDQGHTYTIPITLASSPKNYQIPFGKMVVTHNGALLLPLWESDDYSAINVSVYRAPIVC